MNRIHLRQTLPQVFADRDAITSDVWHRDITFHKGKRYLIEAASGTGNHRFAAMFTVTATIIRESSTLMSSISVHSPSMTGQIYANTPSAFFSGVAYLSRTYRHREHTTEEPAYQLQKKERSPYPIRGNRHCRQGKRKSREAIFRPATKSRLYPQPLPAFRLHLPGRTHQPSG